MNEIMASNSTPSSSIAPSSIAASAAVLTPNTARSLASTEPIEPLGTFNRSSASLTASLSNNVQVELLVSSVPLNSKEDQSIALNNDHGHDQSMSDDEEGGLIIKEDSDSPSMHSACDQPFCDQIKQMDLDNDEDKRENEREHAPPASSQLHSNATSTSTATSTTASNTIVTNNETKDELGSKVKPEIKCEQLEEVSSHEKTSNVQLVAINDSNNNLHLNLNASAEANGSMKRRSSSHSNQSNSNGASTSSSSDSKDKSKDPSEEDIIDGFAILSFKYLQDLKVISILFSLNFFFQSFH